MSAETALGILPGPVDQRVRLQFSPDGKLLVGFYEKFAANGSDYFDHLRVWRVRDGAVLHDERLLINPLFGSYSWRPDGRTLALTDQSGPVRLIRIDE